MDSNKTHPDNEAGAVPISEPSDRFGHLFELIRDAVVELEIVEDEPIIRAVNPAFEEIFGYDVETVRGKSLNRFIVPESHGEQAESFDERTAAGKPNHAIVTRKTATGRREFLYRGVPYQRPDGNNFAFAIYSDITEQRRYERNLQVIHRILRHTLRNELAVVLGTLDQLEAGLDDPERRERAALAAEHARRLLDIGDKTRTLERVILDDQPTGIHDTAGLCRSVTERLNHRFPDGTVTAELPSSLPVTASGHLETALEELVENALIHGGDAPFVHITGSERGGEVFLDITDDGPGIPERERAPVFDDGDITQLDHGSGVGLWLVRAIVETSGGQLAYDRTTDNRTLVRLRLPAGEE